MTAVPRTAGRLGVRRGVSLLAAGSVIGLVHTDQIDTHSLVFDTLVLASGLALAVGAGLAALSVRESRLPRVDAVVLAGGLTVLLAQFAKARSSLPIAGTDETVLNRLAMKALLAGHNPYALSYPQAVRYGPGTPLLGGGRPPVYGYPPLELELGRVIGWASSGLATPAVVGLLAITGLAVGVFLALPGDWRPLAVIAVLGLGTQTVPALTGETVVLAVALLVVPLWRWTDTGADGRLGRRGVAQAAVLGLAVSAGQLAWFVAPVLVLGVWLVRHGELGVRRAASVVARYVGIAAVAAALVNLPFVIASPHYWWRGVSVLVRSPAVPAGGGWALPAIEWHGGSDRLVLLTWSTVLLYVVALLLYGAWFRRCGRALAVVPSVCFLLASRSMVEYVAALVPLWLVGAATASGAAVAGARPVRLPARLQAALGGSARRRIVVTAALVLAPAVLFVIGVTGPPPVHLDVSAAQVRRGTGSSPVSRVTRLTVLVTDHADRPVRPTYYVDQRDAVVHAWVVVSGPATLRPGQRARVVLRPRAPDYPNALGTDLWLVALTGDPQGMTAIPLRVPDG